MSEDLFGLFKCFLLVRFSEEGLLCAFIKGLGQKQKKNWGPDMTNPAVPNNSYFMPGG